MGVGAGVEPHVIPIRFDPINGFTADKNDPAVFLKYEPVIPHESGAQILKECVEPLPRWQTPGVENLVAGVVEGLLKALAVERLEQVVNRVELERFKGVLVVSGNENDQRRLGGGADCLTNVEAAEHRHLHIEKHQVRLLFQNNLHSLAPIRALSGDLEVGVGFEQLPQARAGGRFVVRNQGSDFALAGHRFAPRLCSGKPRMDSN